MSLATPSDYDEDQSDESSDDDTPAEQSPAGDQSDTQQRDATVTETSGPSTNQLRRAIERNISALETKAEEDRVDSLFSYISELEDRVAKLEKNSRTLDDYLLELEQHRRGWIRTIDQNEEVVAQLVAAVFDENPECPECRDGQLVEGNSLLTKHLVCSNDDCEFQREIAPV